jgi:hypothetical protein
MALKSWHFFSRFIAAASVYLSLAGPCTGTTVVVIWTPSGTIIGADAKIRTGDMKDAGTACKIGQVYNNILWAESGILGVRNSGTDFGSIVSTALDSTGTLDHRLADLESKIVPRLIGILNAPLIKASVLEAIPKDPHSKGLQIVVAIYEGGRSRAMVRQFTPAVDKAGAIGIEISRSGCPDDPGCTGSQYFLFGQHESADKVPLADLDFYKIPAVEIIRHLIGMEIEVHPESVGPPVAVAMVGEQGVKWLSNGVCKPN